MIRSAAILAAVCVLSACAAPEILESKTALLNRQAGLKLDQLEAAGCPNNDLFHEWLWMRRTHETDATLMRLNEDLDEAIKKCPAATSDQTGRNPGR